MLRIALAALAVTVSPTLAEDIPEGMIVAYACDGGGKLTVAYINPAGLEEFFAVVFHDGALVPMKAGISGSGVRYVSIGSRSSSGTPRATSASSPATMPTRP